MANPTIKRSGPDDEFFSDFSINLDRNPVTGNLAKITNEEAVKSSFRNIVMTMQGEWPHHRLLGSRVYRMLFQPVSQITANIIKQSIEQAATFEARAQVISITVTPRSDDLGYSIKIMFYTVCSTELQSFSQILYRIRN